MAFPVNSLHDVSTGYVILGAVTVLLLAIYKVNHFSYRRNSNILTFFRYSVTTDIPKLKGVFEIPGGLPFLGLFHMHG